MDSLDPDPLAPPSDESMPTSSIPRPLIQFRWGSRGTPFVADVQFGSRTHVVDLEVDCTGVSTKSAPEHCHKLRRTTHDGVQFA
ncbi:hypothetical protein ZWY2020_025503 [Hordeum vulgare]|nr:hypothetical protein ZWY2020_025503 [Hordeum vulgare]